MSIGYSIPANYSKEHIDRIKDILENNKKNKRNDTDYISDIYGSLPFSYIGQTRFPKEVPNITLNELKWYISEIHKIKIPFYLVINNPWSKAREYKKAGREAIFRELNALIEIGIDGVILANPYLIKLIREKYPELNITVSTNLQISSYNIIQNYLELGADYIVLGRDVNRNFNLLKIFFKKFSERLILLANTSCILFCPLVFYHSLITGYTSTLKLGSDISNRRKIKSELIDEDFCIKFCMNEITTNPESILKATWIRPEDIIHYEKIGLKYLKIQGRTISVNHQLSIINAYINRKIPNNDLFFIWPNFRESLLKFILNNPSQNRTNFNFQIKNSDLDKYNFFKFFINSKWDCRKGCIECKHCENIFNKIK